MTDTKPLLAWSHSRIETFKKCRKQFWHFNIKKDVPFEQSEQMKYGERCHKALELRLATNEPLPPEFRKHEGIAAAIAAMPGQTFAEIKLTLNEKLTPTGYFAKDAYVRAVVDVMKLAPPFCFVGDWKGLPLDTPLPTPTGWTTMGEVALGDTVFSAAGVPCRVVGKSRVKHLPCYKIAFDDTTSVVCDSEHLWSLVSGEVLPAEALRPNMCIPVCGAVELPEADLPIHPYVLGLWLADGKHTSGEISKPDDFVWEEVRRCGYDISHDYSERARDGKCRVHTVLGLRSGLRGLGLLGNKHIPALYLRASKAQRVALLQGIMDGDGSVNHVRRQVVLTTTDASFSAQCLELILSLGQRATAADVEAKGFGLTTRSYPIVFRPHGFNPFRLPRKASACADFGPGYGTRRRIVAVEQVEPRPTQCIAVDSPDHTYLCTEKFIPTHNTGKMSFDGEQLKLTAAVVFQHYPDVDTVASAYLWLKDGVPDVKYYKREELPRMWEELLQEPAKMQEAYVMDAWPAKPGPGKCGWCTVNKYGKCPEAAERYRG